VRNPRAGCHGRNRPDVTQTWGHDAFLVVQNGQARREREIFGGAPPGVFPLLYHSCEGQPRDSVGSNRGVGSTRYLGRRPARSATPPGVRRRPAGGSCCGHILARFCRAQAPRGCVATPALRCLTRVQLSLGAGRCAAPRRRNPPGGRRRLSLRPYSGKLPPRSWRPGRRSHAVRPSARWGDQRRAAQARRLPSAPGRGALLQPPSPLLPPSPRPRPAHPVTVDGQVCESESRTGAVRYVQYICVYPHTFVRREPIHRTREAAGVPFATLAAAAGRCELPTARSLGALAVSVHSAGRRARVHTERTVHSAGLCVRQASAPC